MKKQKVMDLLEQRTTRLTFHQQDVARIWVELGVRDGKIPLTVVAFVVRDCPSPPS